jgi:flavorubredoxin
MARIDEVAPDLYRVSIYMPQFDLQFNHFLIRDDEPLLFHTGMRRMFPEVRDAVARLIDPAALRWISWSHFEVDECGALNEWLAAAPRAEAICSQVGAAVNIQDFADRPPRGLAKDDVIETGRHRYRFVPTPHLPQRFCSTFDRCCEIDPQWLTQSRTAFTRWKWRPCAAGESRS